MPTEAPPEPGAGKAPENQASERRPLSPAAARALAEAAMRRAERERLTALRPKEINGPSGAEPTRYGDWEVKGIASDF